MTILNDGFDPRPDASKRAAAAPLPRAAPMSILAVSWSTSPAMSMRAGTTRKDGKHASGRRQ